MKTCTRRFGTLNLTLAVLLSLAETSSRAAPPAAGAPSPSGSVELVESVPIETTLDHADIPNTPDVWLGLVRRAQKTLDLAQFYVTSQPGSAFAAVLAEIGKAAERGVRVRLIADGEFARVYPDELQRLGALPNAEVRRLDAKRLMGGVLHAKYFIVDDREAFIGSQNFDWRSLQHIQELGVHVTAPGALATLRDVFDTDWALAGGGTPSARVRTGEVPPAPDVVTFGGTPVTLRLGVSPMGWLPHEGQWDLPQLLDIIDGARKTLAVQVLTFQPGPARGRSLNPLSAALERAAARGVQVQVLVADWCKRKKVVSALKRLQKVPGITIKFITIPQWTGGFLSFARVIHAKYLVADGERAWLGTGNWERDYFLAGRNVSVFVDGRAFAEALQRFFRTGFDGPYATPVDPNADYTPPRVQ